MAKQNKGKKHKPKKTNIWLPRDVRDMNGVQFEHYVAAQLKKVGYRSVEVTQQSGDYGADIIAYSPAGIFSTGSRVCFQCKKYNKPVGVKAVQEVMGAMVFYKCDKGVVVSTSGFTNAAVNLANSAKIILMDVNNIRTV